MNKNKISPELLEEVSVLESNHRKNIFISTSNFNKTKKFLNQHKYSYTPYRFAKCFYLSADMEDITLFSNLEEVSLIQSCAFVQAQSKEQDFMSKSATLLVKNAVSASNSANKSSVSVVVIGGRVFIYQINKLNNF